MSEIAAASQKPKQSFVKAVVAGTLGNVLEWFDYGLYGYFAAIIATNFFVSDDPSVALILSFMTFGIGFLARPLGGLVVGAYADKHGRIKAITFCIVGMGVCTALMGCLPTYEQIGIAAPILLATLRICQGLLCGGEFGSSLTFLSEYARPNNKGFITSWQPFSVGVGLLMGSFTGLLMSSLLSEADLYAWGWRLPFLLGLLIAFYAMHLNKNVEDTPAFREMQQKQAAEGAAAQPKTSTAHLFTKHAYSIITVFLILAGASVTYYLLITYMPTYLSQFVGGSLSNSFTVNTGAICVYLVMVPLAGMVIDKIGPRRAAIVAPICYMALAYPVFWFLTNHTDSILGAIGVMGALLIFQALLAVAVAVISTEIFPTELRNSGVGLAYNLAVAIFGGFAPTAATAVIAGTGDVMSITWLIFGSMIVTLLTATFLLKRFYEGGRLKEQN